MSVSSRSKRRGRERGERRKAIGDARDLVTELGQARVTNAPTESSSSASRIVAHRWSAQLPAAAKLTMTPVAPSGGCEIVVWNGTLEPGASGSIGHRHGPALQFLVVPVAQRDAQLRHRLRAARDIGDLAVDRQCRHTVIDAAGRRHLAQLKPLAWHGGPQPNQRIEASRERHRAHHMPTCCDHGPDGEHNRRRNRAAAHPTVPRPWRDTAGNWMRRAAPGSGEVVRTTGGSSGSGGSSIEDRCLFGRGLEPSVLAIGATHAPSRRAEGARIDDVALFALAASDDHGPRDPPSLCGGYRAWPPVRARKRDKAQASSR